MGNRDTVLAYMAFRSGVSTENLATDALCYILNSSAVARAALRDIVTLLGGSLDDSARYESQTATESGARPDIVARSENGATPLVLEAKFWAGLTDAQPLEYLGILPPSGGLLLFVVPEARSTILWRELLLRCAGTTQVEALERADALVATVGHSVMAVIGWRRLLSALAEAAERGRDLEAASDVRQLLGLSDKMDAEAFLPLTTEELSSNLGRRVGDFCDLSLHVVETLSGPQFSTKGLRSSGGNGWSGRYFRINGFGCLLMFNSWLWCEHGGTPLWLQVCGSNFKPSASAKAQLKAARVPFYDEDGNCQIPIRLPKATERDGVIASMMQQIGLVAAALSSPDPGPGAPPSEPII